MTLNNHSPKSQKGTLGLDIHPWKKSGEVVWNEEQKATIAPGKNTVSFTANVPEAELWELSGYRKLEKASMYEALVSFEGRKMEDSKIQRFGFRWF